MTDTIIPAQNNIYRPAVMKIAATRNEAPGVKTLRLEFQDTADQEKFAAAYRTGMFVFTASMVKARALSALPAQKQGRTISSVLSGNPDASPQPLPLLKKATLSPSGVRTEIASR